MSMIFAGKAAVLRLLAGRLTHSRVPRLDTVSLGDWRANPDAQLARIQKVMGPRLAVRSSARGEDGDTTSAAGRYRSVLDVECQNTEALHHAIDEVFASYTDPAADEEVLIQDFIGDVALAGVIFTRDLNGAPYYVINYDKSGRSDLVTSGAGRSLTTAIASRSQPRLPEALKGLVRAIHEIEQVAGREALDIEFAIDPAGLIHIFQVRPLVFAEDFSDKIHDTQFDHILLKLHLKIGNLQLRHPELHGDTSGFGVMPDWNPAEIIGFRPRRLAISLYKELITDSVWAEQRAAYGYKDLRSFPLLISFVGIPFIDVRTDLNSFIPGDLVPASAEKLLTHYLETFKARPELHDKIEFDVVFSCAFPGLKRRLEPLAARGFSSQEREALAGSLARLTQRVMAPGGLFGQDLERLKILPERYRAVVDSPLHPINRIYWLVQDCKRYGTLPFAGLARSAFIAMQMLNGLVDENILSPGQREDFLRSLNTTVRCLQRDVSAYHAGHLSREVLLECYGHLRQGTYDVTHERYDSDFERFFAPPSAAPEPGGVFSCDAALARRVEAAFKVEGLSVEAVGLFDFMRHAIEAREEAKLSFTRHVSRLIEEIVALCQPYGFQRDDISFLDLDTLLRLYGTLDHRDLYDILREDIARNRAYYEYTKRIQLPALTFDPAEVYGFEISGAEPNFITLGKVRAPVEVGATHASPLQDRIVFIESADPGYDWIFGRGIAGLVTCFGGANSHMAIRCAELGLPAVIGAGEADFARWSRARLLDVDCAARLVIPIP